MIDDEKTKVKKLTSTTKNLQPELWDRQFLRILTASAVLERLTGMYERGTPNPNTKIIGDHVLKNHFIKSIDENDFPGNFQTNE